MRSDIALNASPSAWPARVSVTAMVDTHTGMIAALRCDAHPPPGREIRNVPYVPNYKGSE